MGEVEGPPPPKYLAVMVTTEFNIGIEPSPFSKISGVIWATKLQLSEQG